MPWLLGILGCGCPDFEDVVVVPDDTVADPEGAIAEAEAAVAEFAAWTGRAGVCVDRVEVRAEVEHGSPSGPVVVEGFYAGWRNAVVMREHWTLPDTLRHELCHALDGMERLSPGREDLFPPDSVDRLDLYTTDAERTAEAFALACEATPDDLTLKAAASASCGVDFVSERERFFDEIVYPGFPEGMPVASGAPLALEWRAIYTPPEGVGVVELAGSPNGLTLLVHASVPTPHGEGHEVLRVLDVDVDTGGVTRRWAFPVPKRAARWPGHYARVIPSDTEDTFVGVGREVYRVRPAGAELVWQPRAYGEHLGAAVVSGGVLYAYVWDEAPRLTAWHLATGAELDVPTTGLGDHADPSPSELWPADGGVEALFGDEVFARLHRGTWTTWPALPNARHRVGGGSTRTFLAYVPLARAQPVTLDLETRAWTVRPDCEEGLSLQTPLVQAAGRAWAVREDRVEGGPELLSISVAELAP